MIIQEIGNADDFSIAEDTDENDVEDGSLKMERRGLPELMKMEGVMRTTTKMRKKNWRLKTRGRLSRKWSKTMKIQMPLTTTLKSISS